MVVAPLEVDSAERLRFVAVIAGGERDLAARVVRARQSPGDIEGRRTEERGIDPVVDEPAAQVDLASAGAGGRRHRGEVAGQHLRGRDPGNLIGRAKTK